MPSLNVRAAPRPPTRLRPLVVIVLSGLSLAVASPVAQTQGVSIERIVDSDQYAAYIVEAAKRFGIPETWIRAVMRVESAGELHALSAKGAMGLMQIMPATWLELRARHGLGDDPYDPRDNILAGAAYLSELHDRYGSPGFLAAYNAGPGRYEAYLRGRPLPAETQAYVAALVRVIDFNRSLERPQSRDRSDDARSNPWQPREWTDGADDVKPRRSVAPPDTTQTSLSARNASALRPFAGDLFVGRSATGSGQ